MKHTWRLSGFDEKGNLVELDMPTPETASDAMPYRDSVVIGRNPELCELVVKDQAVSRKHAEVCFIPETGLCIRDLGSLNGTFVNGQKIDDHYVRLDRGAEIEIGSVLLSVSVQRQR